MEMSVMKTNSTGKSTPKKSYLTRMTDYATCPKLLQKRSDSNFERPQPIKIKHLLEEYKDSKSAKKDSVCKKILPERLGVLSTSKKANIGEKQNGTTGPIRHSVKRVQRHLNFNAIPIDATKKNIENKTPSHNFVNNGSVSRKESVSARRSLLLPPNTIKGRHLKKHIDGIHTCSKISEVSNEMLDETTVDSVAGKDTEIGKSLSSHDKHLSTTMPSIKTELYPKQEATRSSNYLKPKLNNTKNTNNVQYTDASCITTKSQVSNQHVSPRQVTINGKNQLHVQNDSTCTQCTSSMDTKKKVSLNSQEADTCIDDLCNNLRDTELVVTEPDMPIECDSSEIICVSKDKIIRLEHELKCLLIEAEKNVSKLRLATTYVTRLLSITEEGKSCSNVDKDGEHTESKSADKIMVDKEIQVETCCKAIGQCEDQFKTPEVRMPSITITNMQSITKILVTQNNESNKENETANLRMSDNVDGSFLELENQLNIAHGKPIEDQISHLKTPKLIKTKQKRSLREYMALKSSISFLETPDGKKFRSLCQANDIDNSTLNRRYISSKLLTDLHNLYSDSPDN